jgi:hypothetical protein
MEHTRTTLAALAAAALCAGGAAAAPERALDETTCRGAIGARSIDGDVRVPSGATCRLTGTQIDDNVKVYRGATLIAIRVRVGGNIQAENARTVRVRRSRVGGNVQLKQGRRGDIAVTDNRVGADVQLFSNVGPSVVARNVIGGNLQCKSNRPRPTGGANRVEGNKEDQCRRL